MKQYLFRSATDSLVFINFSRNSGGEGGEWNISAATPVPFGVSADLFLLILGGLYGASRLRKKLASK